MNWQQIINELVQADSAGMNQVQTQQTQVNSQVTALGAVNTDLTNLANSIFSLEDPSLYSAVSVSSNTANSTWQANATVGTPPGSYTLDVTKLATASVLTGTNTVANPLNSSADVSGLTLANMQTFEPVTAGTFTVNGQQITVTTSESLQDVFAAISTATASAGGVTASYDPTGDQVKLQSTSGNIVLGAANDTSNFLQALKLQNNGTGTILSAGTLGSLNANAMIANTGLATALSGQDSSGNGTMVINGVTIDYNINTDSLNTLLGRITNSNAGVTASYNAYDNQILLTNSTTGDIGMGVSDGTGNLAAALGLTGAGSALTQGFNAQFTVNGGATQTSESNTLTGAALGVPGLSVTVDTPGSQTIEVAADTSGIQSAIQSFITAFNQVQTDIQSDTQITTDSNGTVTPSILSSDHEVGDWASQLQMTAFSAGSSLTGPINSLDALGIDFNGTTGQLEISDQGALLGALSSNASSVAAFFQTGKTGFGSVMNAAITDIQNQLSSDKSNLEAESTDLGNQISTMQSQLTAEQNQLEQEFEAMETFESQYQTEMSALNSLSGSSSSSSSSSGSSTAQSAQSSNVYVNGSQVANTSSSSSSSSGSSSSTS